VTSYAKLISVIHAQTSQCRRRSSRDRERLQTRFERAASGIGCHMALHRRQASLRQPTTSATQNLADVEHVFVRSQNHVLDARKCDWSRTLTEHGARKAAGAGRNVHALLGSDLRPNAHRGARLTSLLANPRAAQAPSSARARKRTPTHVARPGSMLPPLLLPPPPHHLPRPQAAARWLPGQQNSKKHARTSGRPKRNRPATGRGVLSVHAPSDTLALPLRDNAPDRQGYASSRDSPVGQPGAKRIYARIAGARTTHRKSGGLRPHAAVEADDAGLVDHLCPDQLVIHVGLPAHPSVLGACPCLGVRLLIKQ
jgi:hypothetical protein